MSRLSASDELLAAEKLAIRGNSSFHCLFVCLLLCFSSPVCSVCCTFVVALLAEQDLPGGAKVEPGLGSALVRSGLQPDQALAGPQLLLGELAPILLGRPGSQVGAAELRMLVALAMERKEEEEEEEEKKQSVILVSILSDGKHLPLGQRQRWSS